MQHHFITRYGKQSIYNIGMNVLKTVDVCVKRRVLEDPLLQKNKMILCVMFLYEVQENLLLHQQVKNCKFVNPLWKILQKFENYTL